MNDRFKFRVWDKTRNKYIKSPEPTPLLQANGLLAYFKDAEPMKNYVIQFCTGLRDKNNKLIYEGDIVIKKVFIDYQGDGQFQPDVYIDREYIGVVHFSASNGATLQKVKIFETESPYEPKKQREKRECPKATKLIACRSEVIGNIYQDPDYLEDIQKIIEAELKE